MERIIIKHTIGGLIGRILGVIAIWVVLPLMTNKSGTVIVVGLVATTLVIGVFLIKWFKASIVIETDKIVIQTIFTAITICKKELIEVKVKLVSIVLIKSNGFKYEILLRDYKQADIIFMKDYFEDLLREVSLSEGDL